MTEQEALAQLHLMAMDVDAWSEHMMDTARDLARAGTVLDVGDPKRFITITTGLRALRDAAAAASQAADMLAMLHGLMTPEAPEPPQDAPPSTEDGT